MIRFLQKTALMVASVSAVLFSVFAHAELVVIGGAQMPVNRLSAQQLKNLYLDRAGNSDITPLDIESNSDIYAAFYQKLFDWGPSQIGNYWSSQVFSGGATPPNQVDSQAQAIAIVVHSRNHIAYVDSSALRGLSGYKVLYTFGPALQMTGATQSKSMRQPQAVVRYHRAPASQLSRLENMAQSTQARPHHLTLHPQPKPKPKPKPKSTRAAVKAAPTTKITARDRQNFAEFMKSFQSFNRLLKTSSGQTYFSAVRLDPKDPNSVQIRTTAAWWALAESQRMSIINTILKQWQQSMVYNKSEAAIEITDLKGMNHKYSGAHS